MKKIKHFLFISILLSGLFFSINTASAQNRWGFREYTVKSGDTIWSICKGCKLNFRSTLGYNGHFKNPDLIYPGDKVYLPKTEVPTPTPEATPDPTPEPTPETAQPEPEPTPEPTEPEATPEVAQDISAMEQEVIRLVNVERQKNGLEPYTHNSKLSSVARKKSEDMRDNRYFSHQSPTYGSPFEMLSKFGVNYSAAAENLAKGQKTAQRVVTSWMNSPGHRRNILSPKLTQIGVGLVKDASGMTYWTQMFIRP